MKDIIEQQLISLLQPLLDVTLRPATGDIEQPEPYAELELTAAVPLGMGSEQEQSVDDLGNLRLYRSYRGTVAVRGFGDNAMQQLLQVVSGLNRVSVSEQFQRAKIGVSGFGSITTKAAAEEDENKTRAADAEFSLSIHYSTLLNDAVGVIETIRAAHDDGEISINLTR